MTTPAWTEDADYPVADWRAEVLAGDTHLGYEDWVWEQGDIGAERQGESECWPQSEE